ncbi:MAG: ATP-binding protein [candidate division Zixibacteria bacterium]|nr:ATP-binding protein [candidate division Zixibacteria bacterium]MDH3938515.1 ATP-binding protein [candidate division Zixibacteria bacterium]MDH4032859.1 ATP-binding protein [candidate division Zixibacteria bacterium]
MSLGLKLYISLFLVMFIGLSVFTVLTITDQKQDMLQLVRQSAIRTTELIESSIHYSMLINRKEDIDQIFKNFETMSGFEVIRIYDKTGRIIFTTRPDEKDGQVAITSRACQVCHQATKPLKSVGTTQRQRIVRAAEGGHDVLALTQPINNEPSCAIVGCHVSLEERTVLGVLDVQMSLETVYANLARNQRQTVIVSVILVLIVLTVVGVLIYSLILVPVRTLSQGTKAIAKGDLSYKIPIRSADEIGELASSFNRMTEELRKAHDEITEWSATLQEKVDQKTEELQQIQTHLAQVEKMASLGKLAATVAHELNNPLEGILTYTRLTRKRLAERRITPELLSSIEGDLSIVCEETLRSGSIVKNLLLFSKREMREFASRDVKHIVEHGLQLVQHHLELNEITLVTVFSDEPIEAVCDRNQLQQALLALFMNAVEAMPQGGHLTVGVLELKDSVRISIQDTGCGIPTEFLAHIFEPFYSGKKGGRGVGLGLSVAYGIIEAHSGRIEVESTVNQGSTFTVEIPKRLPADNSAAESISASGQIEGDRRGS